MKKNKILIFFLCLILSFCDTKKNGLPYDIRAGLLCRVGVICDTQRGTKYGIIGDSWTDLLFGVPAIETLRVQLEKYYGYQLVGSTLGGQTLDVVNKTLLFTRVIDEAGPDIKYILLSLGGNDLQGNPSKFVGRFQEEKQDRLNQIKKDFQFLIQNGNIYKMQKYGGAPLVWFVHGYDYSNPDVRSTNNSTSCRPTLRSAGFTDADVNTFGQEGLNDFNRFLVNLTTIEPQLRYIDLRTSLGGPPFSSAGNMFDCIHPTSGGFSILAKKYVTVLQGYTNNEK